MKIQGQEIVVEWARKKSLRMQVLHATQCNPAFAIHPEIRSVIEGFVRDPAVGTGLRVLACRTLARAGVPEAIDWLVDTALSHHPVFGWDQTGWEVRHSSRTALLPFADQVSEKAVDLLVEDMCRQDGNAHLEVLSAARKELVLPKLAALSPMSEGVSAQVAFVQAMQGDERGRDLLESFLRRGLFFDVALIGLSHFRDSRAALQLGQVVDSGAEIFAEKLRAYTRDSNLDLGRRILPRICFWFRVAQSNRENLAELIHNYFGQVGNDGYSEDADRRREPRVGEPLLFPTRFDGHASFSPALPSFLAYYADDELRRSLAARQLEIIKILLERQEYGLLEEVSSIHGQGIRGLTELNRFKDEGVTATVEEDDYSRFGTDWILNAAKYRAGIFSASSYSSREEWALAIY